MAKTDEGFKGYRARFDKAGQTIRETNRVSTCPECGLPMEVQQTWRKSPVDPERTSYRIVGLCPAGHAIERYGYGGPVT